MATQNLSITNQIENNCHLYEGCGNRLLIVHLSNFNYDDYVFRKSLQKIGLAKKVDSVLVLTGDPKNVNQSGYHVSMDVFEPRGVDLQSSNLPGSWSTMCGNGIRAVARYLIDKESVSVLIKTKSGIRPTTILPTSLYRVCMGQFTADKRDLQKYVSNFAFERFKISNEKFKLEKIVAGLNGDRGNNNTIDGEPHLMFIFKKGYQLDDLVNLASKSGLKIIKNRDFFPLEINANFISIQHRNADTLSLFACTFERGVNYVTQACGTGATAIGSYLLSSDKTLSTIIINMPGGALRVERGPKKQFCLTGGANPLI